MELLYGAGIFLAGVLVGCELYRNARSGRPVVSLPPIKRKKGAAPERVHPGSHRL